MIDSENVHTNVMSNFVHGIYLILYQDSYVSAPVLRMEDWSKAGALVMRYQWFTERDPHFTDQRLARRVELLEELVNKMGGAKGKL